MIGFGMKGMPRATFGSPASGPLSDIIGPRDMHSTPPTATRPASPIRARAAPIAVAVRPEVQKLFPLAAVPDPSQPDIGSPTFRDRGLLSAELSGLPVH